MPQSEKPKVPPQQHRSTGDTGVPQRGDEEMTDDPGQAVESGEQDETSRSRGRVIDESGQAAGKPPQTGKGGKGEHWESGRHKAQ